MLNLAKWLYRGGRPNWMATALNRLWAAVHAIGVAPNYLVTLEVKGRRSGRRISLPLVMVVIKGERYLVSMLGSEVEWVRNVMAADGNVTIRHGRREEAHLEEVAADRRAPLLKAYLKRAPGARQHLPVHKNAPLSEFERVSAQFPVFRVVSRSAGRISAEQGPSEGSSDTIASRSRTPLTFFLLVFALSIPFWLIGAVTRLHLAPGLPVSSLGAFCPLMAASILVYRENKTAGVTGLLKRAFDYKRIRAKVWYAPIVLLMPGVMVLTYSLMRLTGAPLPTPQFSVLAALGMLFAFFITALGEEVGWSGYAIDPMQDRWNALQSGILLGLVWAAWHIVPLAQAHRSPAWIAWWCLFTVASRVLMTWLYNNTGKSVFGAVLYHDISNVSWQMFPNYGSHWDPLITGLILAFAALIVTVVCGPRTLARYRTACNSQ